MKKIVITIVKENDLYSFRNLKDSKKSMGIVIFFENGQCMVKLYRKEKIE